MPRRDLRARELHESLRRLWRHLGELLERGDRLTRLAAEELCGAEELGDGGVVRQRSLRLLRSRERFRVVAVAEVEIDERNARVRRGRIAGHCLFQDFFDLL